MPGLALNLCLNRMGHSTALNHSFMIRENAEISKDVFYSGVYYHKAYYTLFWQPL
uniref:Uncharacterized protein n=1 Tax=Anguilla anguilla TaxID=7936 RepID=A0A0E9SJ28_ANGAN